VVYREINIVHGLWIVVGTDTPLDDTINMFILRNPYLYILQRIIFIDDYKPRRRVPKQNILFHQTI